MKSDECDELDGSNISGDRKRYVKVVN